MFHVELAPLGGILGPRKSDLGVFWANALYPKIFNGKIFRGKYPRNPYALRIQKMYMKGGYNKFLTLLRSDKVG